MENQLFGGLKKTLMHPLSSYIIPYIKRYIYGAKVSNMKDKDIPKTVKKLRTAMGLTQEQFAAKIGVTFSLADGKMAKENLLR